MKKKCDSLWLITPLAGLLLSSLSMASDTGPEITDPHFKLAPGYLEPARLPVHLALLGAPPKADSAAFARDEEARQTTIALRGTPREALAASDAELTFPAPAQTFSCALGIDINEKNTPHLYTMMQRILTDAGGSTYAGKNTYNRTRPFVQHHEGTCRKDMEPLLQHDGSWPSGHAAAGWAWGLVLSEVQPERANELLARGLAFGQSRVICNAHWQSDVDAGRLMGAATVAVLQSDAGFQADLAAAKREVQEAAKTKLRPSDDCATELAVLSSAAH